MAMVLRDKRELLKTMKFNQRSTFNFKAKGLYGPKAILWESLDPRRQEEYKKDGFTLEDPHSEHHLFWSEPPENVLVIKKFKDKDVTLKFMDLTRWLVEEKKLDVVVEPSVLNEATILEDHSYERVRDSLLSWEEGNQVSREECLDSVDLIVCVGGDGTLLYTSSLFQSHLPPILSFHLGSLGFLAPFQFETDDVESSGVDVTDKTSLYQKYIEKALQGGVSLTLRHRLECIIQTDELVGTSDRGEECPISPSEFDNKLKFGIEKKLRLPDSRTKALPKMLVMNDLVVDRGPNPYLTNLIIYCNGRKMTSVQGDGIIIATPTGSTAYSLAAGASMVHPSVPAIVVTPICPHSLSFRSIVVPAGVELMVKVAPSSRNSAWVSFDGRNRQEITHGNSVTVSTSPCPVPSINNTGHVTDWFDSLAECLHWNIRKEQKAFKAS